jgi:hypothetical protein
MSRITLLTLIVILWSVSLAGQQPVIIRGKVIDATTGEFLPYAHVVIKNKQIAAITDGKGIFNLPLNEVKTDEKILISYVGYISAEFVIASYISRSDSLIRLKPKAIELNEVVISAGKVDLPELMEETARLYSKGIRKTPHIAKGHYREKAKINSRYVMYAESIGYAVYNGLDKLHSGYSFFCENTRKSESPAVWRNLAGNGSTNNEKLSDVLSNSGGTFQILYQCENYGPISEIYAKAYTYHLDSTYFVANRKFYGIGFVKGDESGSILIDAGTNNISSIRYFSKTMSGRPLDKPVKGDAKIEFIYLDKVPFVNRVSYHFNSSNLEYWNEYQMLIQKFGHFAFTMKDYYSMIWYQGVPFIEYKPDLWSLHSIQPDPDFPAISDQLNTDRSTLDQQFLANSGKWWISDYQKMSMGSQGPVGFTKQVEISRDLIKRLLRFF